MPRASDALVVIDSFNGLIIGVVDQRWAPIDAYRAFVARDVTPPGGSYTYR